MSWDAGTLKAPGSRFRPRFLLADDLDAELGEALDDLERVEWPLAGRAVQCPNQEHGATASSGVAHRLVELSAVLALPGRRLDEINLDYLLPTPLGHASELLHLVGCLLVGRRSWWRGTTHQRH